MTTQQNNILINLMLNGEFVKSWDNGDEELMVCIYRNDDFQFIYLDKGGKEK